MNLFKKLLICCYLFNNINLILGDKVSEDWNDPKCINKCIDVSISCRKKCIETNNKLISQGCVDDCTSIRNVCYQSLCECKMKSKNIVDVNTCKYFREKNSCNKNKINILLFSILTIIIFMII